MDPDQFDASAQGDIKVSGIGGPLVVGSVISSAGNIVLTAGNATAGTEDLRLSGTSNVSAAAGTVTLRAENNVSIAAGSMISAAQGDLAIEGDYNNSNPGAGTNMQVLARFTPRW